MKQYTVTGMSCAACQARVEKAVSKVEGVDSCSVSLLTNSMGVEGSADPAAVIAAVENAGYGAALKSGGGHADSADGAADTASASGAEGYSARLAAEEEALRDKTTPLLRRRLLASLGFLLVLMYFSMGHMMWGWPVPAFFRDNHVAMGLLQMLLAGIIMVINQRFFVSGFRSLFHGAPNMDTLIAVGSGAAFVYSTIILFAMTDAQLKNDSALVMKYMMEFYFESAAMILTLITVGKMLESYSKGKTTSALKSLMKLAPKTACVIRDGQEVTVSVDAVRKGDIFLVRPGENIPVDGIVLEGNSAINESALTGESIPVDKQAGDTVSSATLNQSGLLRCEATRVGEDTTLAQIIQMVSDAAATKAPVAKLADTISGYFVPAVLILAAVVTVIWLLTGRGTGFALARGISVLVVSCPCALGLATPVAIMVGNGVGARNGILFKTADALQETGNVVIAALDKTGTITSGQPKVTDVLPAGPVSEDELLQLAASLEKGSEHPLARAVLDYADEQHITASKVENFTALPGNGLTATLDGRELTGGSYAYMSQLLAGRQASEAGETVRSTDAARTDAGDAEAESALQADYERLSGEGKTPLVFACDGRLLGMIAVADTIKEDSAEAIRQMQNMGIHVVMLTGDNERTARAIGQLSGVNEVVAGVRPEGKEEVIRALQAFGKVAMVGDGINDAPALTRADIGIAIGAGTDVAIDAADVVLMKSSLADAAAAARLSRSTYRNILENLFWALIYNTILIPVAAGAFVHWGITMNPMFGAAAMSLSSFCVVSNALRLNLCRLYDGSHDRRGKKALHVGPEGLLGRPAAGTGENAEGAAACARADGETAASGSAAGACGTKCGQTEEETRVIMGRPDEPGAGKEKAMTKNMKIEGMMCGHCAATVKKALEAVDGVTEAVVSHEDGSAKVTLSSDVADEVLRQAVEAKDYNVVGIS